MLLSIREKAHGVIAWTIIGFLCLIFALWGVQYYLGSHRTVAQVAQVNGVPITQKAFDAAYYRERERWMVDHAKSDQRLTPEVVKTLKQNTLHRMLRSQALSQSAQQQGYRIPDHFLASVVQNIPAFQEKGGFSEKRLVQILQRMGYAESTFFSDLERDLLMSQMRFGITNSSFILPQERQNVVEWEHQLRDAQYVILPFHSIDLQKGVTEAAIQAYYAQHTDAFQEPEQVSITYLRLALSEVRARLQRQGKDTSQASSLFAEELDQLSDLSYTHPESLLPAAKALGLSLKETPWFPQTGGERGLIAQPKIVQAAYSDAVLQEGNNSRPIALSDEEVIVLRIAQHRPTARQPLARVRAQIRTRLLKEAAQVQLASLSHSWVSQLQEGKLLRDLARSRHLRVHKVSNLKRSSTQLPLPLHRKIFALPEEGPGARFAAIPLHQGEYAVLELLQVRKPKLSSVATKEKAFAMDRQWAGRLAQKEYALFIQDVMQHAAVIQSQTMG